MKNKKKIISIFALMISLLACCFVFANNNSIRVSAAENYQDCYYMLGEDSKTYLSNTQVGTIEGLGQFVIGEENVTLAATANDNFKLVGWQIIFSDQADKTIFIDDNDLADHKKNVELLAKDGETKIVASIEFININNVYQKGTFKLARVFENLVVRPVFDNVYYSVDISNLCKISNLTNSKTIGENTLFYENAETDADVISYSNAYVKIGENYFFYGDLFEDAGKFYTLHKTLTNEEKFEKVDYLNGAFRVGDNVEISLNVDVKADNVIESKNIDLQGMFVQADSRVNLVKDATENGFSMQQDALFRTSRFSLNFNIVSSSNQKNVVNAEYHNLYVVDLQINIDGVVSNDKAQDVFGTVAANQNNISSNITINNFYSRVTDDNLQFLVKKAQDNDMRSFRVSSVKNIEKIIDGVSYKYYTFDSLNGVANAEQSYANIDSNVTVVLSYISQTYKIDFACVEYVEAENGNVSLHPFAGNVLDYVEKKRGENIALNLDTAKDVNNIGYKFVGYALSLDGDVEAELNYQVNLQKPVNATIYMCFEKINYQVEFTNYNQFKIGSNYALSSISFTITHDAESVAQTFVASDLAGENGLQTSVTLGAALKIGGRLVIDQVVNPGLNILGYSIKAPQEVTANDYLAKNEGVTELNLDADFIQNNSFEDKIVIYVYEDVIKYTLTYYTEPDYDTSLSQNVIMAKISAEGVGATIVRYDVLDNVIPESDTTTIVKKIVISDLKLGDEVNLLSSGLTVGVAEDAYSYVFNWFTEDNKSTLSYSKDENVYYHTEVISRNREIKVVYSMPTTKIMISVEEEFSNIKEFQCSFKVELGGTQLEAIENTTNVFDVDVGVTITISVFDLSFGYNFVGYKVVGDNSQVTLEPYTTVAGVNTIELKFSRIEYRFLFAQYGGGKNGDMVSFGGAEYAKLDVDHTSVEIEKPLGYYVSSVKFNGRYDNYSEKISETNEYRSNNNQMFVFSLEREDFITIVTDYGVLNKQNVKEILVRLDYSIFEYRVKLQYGLTNPKEDGRDDYVVYPQMELAYEFGGYPQVAEIEYINDEKALVFVGIPYGVDATINVVGDATLGLSLYGWTYPSGKRVSQDEYAHSLQHLELGTVAEDNEFVYLLNYNAYEIKVVYNSIQGNPITYVNNVAVVGLTKQITLYDKLEIIANALRYNGYIFDQITYKVPVYSEYVYTDETWNENCLKLYIQQGEGYKLNTSSIYDENVKYYEYSTLTQTCDTDKFTDDLFMVSNYALDEDGRTITFNVEYELLQLTIQNELIEANDYGWNISKGRGKDDARIEIDLNDLAVITVHATDQNGTTREIVEADTVNVNDMINIFITINKEAVNKIDLAIYDLSLGLDLVNVEILNLIRGFDKIGAGEYTTAFAVKDFIPANGEIIDILYSLKLQAKNVEVTTIIKNSNTFYANLYMSIDAYKYGFHGSILNSDGKASKSGNFQFLSKATVSASFKTQDYIDNFEISGVKVYCDGDFIDRANYPKYGLECNENFEVTARLYRNLKVEFIVQPKLTYNNGGPNYSKVFMCDNLGYGTAQTLTIGNNATFDIQVANFLKDAVTIKYMSSVPGSFEQDDVTNVGIYNVLITFADVEGFDWLDETEVAEKVTLTIVPKDLYVTYNTAELQSAVKIYDGTSDYNAKNIYKYLVFTDKNSFNVNYAEIMDKANSNLVITDALSYISSNGKDAMIAKANENINYNLYVYNITLKNTEYNNNFVLKNTDLVIYNYIKIMRRELRLQNVQVYSKVYDGTDKAEMISTENIVISNAIVGDDVAVNVLKLNPRFMDSSIGTNKKVVVDANNALTGEDVGNYYIKTIETRGLTIYPYSLSVNIRGVGKVEVMNKRGLTQKDKVALIPLNAVLKVSVIYPETPEYVSLHSRISKHLKGNNEFAIGYEIKFIIDGEEFAVDNNLYLSIPNIANLTGTYFLTGQKTGRVEYAFEDGNMLIDLSQIDENISHIYITKVKILLKAWQIVLIVIGVILLIAAIVLTFIIIRKRKVGRDSVHEKI